MMPTPIPADVVTLSAKRSCSSFMAGRCGPRWQDNADQHDLRAGGRSSIPRRGASEHAGAFAEYAARDAERKKEIAVLALRPTYETAARCLLTWVGYKKSKWTGK
jgi:hypothetical protein